MFILLTKLLPAMNYPGIFHTDCEKSNNKKVPPLCQTLMRKSIDYQCN